MPRKLTPPVSSLHIPKSPTGIHGLDEITCGA
ncbi:MAG: hypothetical protein JWL81_1116, partial [Verrucomicrobiales bacterium]|nr:hypothetical protein [Verrucomicrobiales bacterium]